MANKPTINERAITLDGPNPTRHDGDRPQETMHYLEVLEKAEAFKTIEYTEHYLFLSASGTGDYNTVSALPWDLDFTVEMNKHGTALKFRTYGYPILFKWDIDIAGNHNSVQEFRNTLERLECVFRYLDEEQRRCALPALSRLLEHFEERIEGLSKHIGDFFAIRAFAQRLLEEVPASVSQQCNGSKDVLAP